MLLHSPSEPGLAFSFRSLGSGLDDWKHLFKKRQMQVPAAQISE